MKIHELEGKHIRVCPRSIVCIREDGKTCGIVTGVEMFSAMAFRDQVEINGIIKSKSARLSHGNVQNILRCGGELYYIHDLEAERHMREKIAFWSTETAERAVELVLNNRERLDASVRDAETARQIATVINCYVGR